MDDSTIKDQIQFYIDLWNSRKPSGVSHTKENWDIWAERWEKELTEDADRKERSEKRVATTSAFLRENGLLKETDEVIDIGCGPGRFVTEFAKTSKHVTGIDISPNMCEFGRKFANNNGIKNVDFVPCDFSEVNVKEMGWENKFDLVFSSITPAMSTYESFRKAESMSKRYCFQSNFVRTVDDLCDEVLEAALDKSMLSPKRGISGFLAIFNIVSLEGCFPKISFFKETSDGKQKIDEHLVMNILKNAPKVEPTDEIKQRIKEELEKRADRDGFINRHSEWIYGFILWDVTQKIFIL